MSIVVPVAFVHLPTLLVVVVMGVAPVGASVRRPHPDTMHPYVVTSMVAPVALVPNVTLTWHSRAGLVAQWRRCGADIDMDLSDGRSREGKKRYAPGE